MKTPIFKFRAKVWLFVAPKASWHFVTLPKAESEQIKFHAAERIAGWGSVRVHVTIGKTTWDTSLFPDKETGCYFLPLKADVRKKEKVELDKIISVSLKIA